MTVADLRELYRLFDKFHSEHKDGDATRLEILDEIGEAWDYAVTKEAKWLKGEI